MNDLYHIPVNIEHSSNLDIYIHKGEAIRSYFGNVKTIPTFKLGKKEEHIEQLKDNENSILEVNIRIDDVFWYVKRNEFTLDNFLSKLGGTLVSIHGFLQVAILVIVRRLFMTEMLNAVFLIKDSKDNRKPRLVDKEKKLEDFIVT